jgi:hypothetical protein
MAIFKESMHCVNTLFHSQILHLFQFADEMSNSHIYKFSQNNLYSHNVIAGCTNLRNEIETQRTKRNEILRSATKYTKLRNETQRNETYYNAKQNEMNTTK